MFIIPFHSCARAWGYRDGHVYNLREGGLVEGGESADVDMTWDDQGCKNLERWEVTDPSAGSSWCRGKNFFSEKGRQPLQVEWGKGGWFLTEGLYFLSEERPSDWLRVVAVMVGQLGLV